MSEAEQLGPLLEAQPGGQYVGASSWARSLNFQPKEKERDVGCTMYTGEYRSWDEAEKRRMGFIKVPPTKDLRVTIPVYRSPSPV